MNSKEDGAGKAAKLRWWAEELARGQAAASPEPMDAQSTLHELRVHQIELEVQNEELRRVQAELDETQARYFDLYNLAPVGYCILSPEGRILEANHTVVALLGVAWAALARQPITRFIFREDQDAYYLHRKQFLKTNEPQTCELRMLKKNGETFWARLATSSARADGERTATRVVLSDISERKQVEAEKVSLEAQLQQVRKLAGLRARRNKDEGTPIRK